jgi:hypothetical protein
MNRLTLGTCCPRMSTTQTAGPRRVKAGRNALGIEVVSLKGQSYEKVDEITPWGISLGSN